MSLWAIADIHISYKSNREAIQSLKPRPDDGLILAGDSTSQLDFLLQHAKPSGAK
jgi:predicted phosphodiesterase